MEHQASVIYNSVSLLLFPLRIRHYIVETHCKLDIKITH